MGQHEYVCQSCLHKKICPEYHPETYSCVNHVDEADVAPRAEVESIFDELIKAAGEIAEGYKKEADNMSFSDFARTEYRGTQIGALLVQYKIAELKKKYTDATDTNVGHKTKKNKKDAVTDVPIQLSIFDKEDNQ